MCYNTTGDGNREHFDKKKLSKKYVGSIRITVNLSAHGMPQL